RLGHATPAGEGIDERAELAPSGCPIDRLGHATPAGEGIDERAELAPSGCPMDRLGHAPPAGEGTDESAALVASACARARRGPARAQTRTRSDERGRWKLVRSASTTRNRWPGVI